MRIRKAESPTDIAIVQSLWAEYWDSMGLSAEFQGFAEELATLPGRYSAPGGLILLAFADDRAAGTAALRALDRESCEAKRLYVRPAFRGKGLGGKLLEALLENAVGLGYRVIFADTLPSMGEAIRLYERFGFERVEPYSSSPTPGAICLRRFLAA